MNATHIHLALTHFPIVGTLIGFLVLAYGQFAKKNAVKKAAFALFIAMAIITIPVFLTGESAEETVEHLPGVSESVINKHEELAEKAIWLIGLLGLISLIGLYTIIKKTALSNIFSVIILFTSLATFGLFAKVGNLGGQIRHTEIRTATINTQGQNNGNVQQNDEESEEDDDD